MFLTLHDNSGGAYQYSDHFALLLLPDEAPVVDGVSVSSSIGQTQPIAFDGTMPAGEFSSGIYDYAVLPSDLLHGTATGISLDYNSVVGLGGSSVGGYAKLQIASDGSIDWQLTNYFTGALLQEIKADSWADFKQSPDFNPVYWSAVETDGSTYYADAAAIFADLEQFNGRGIAYELQSSWGSTGDFMTALAGYDSTNTVTLTANNVYSLYHSITSVEFFEVTGGGNVSLGTATHGDSNGNWSIDIDPSTFSSATPSIIAVVTDSASQTTTTSPTTLPSVIVGQARTNSDTYINGQNVTVTIPNVVSLAGGSITAVKVYRDLSGTGIFNSATAQLVGTATESGGVWTASIGTQGWVGDQTLEYVAEDSYCNKSQSNFVQLAAPVKSQFGVEDLKDNDLIVRSFYWDGHNVVTPHWESKGDDKLGPPPIDKGVIFIVRTTLRYGPGGGAKALQERLAKWAANWKSKADAPNQNKWPAFRAPPALPQTDGEGHIPNDADWKKWQDDMQKWYKDVVGGTPRGISARRPRATRDPGRARHPCQKLERIFDVSLGRSQPLCLPQRWRAGLRIAALASSALAAVAVAPAVKLLRAVEHGVQRHPLRRESRPCSPANARLIVDGQECTDHSEVHSCGESCSGRAATVGAYFADGSSAVQNIQLCSGWHVPLNVRPPACPAEPIQLQTGHRDTDGIHSFETAISADESGFSPALDDGICHPLEGEYRRGDPDVRRPCRWRLLRRVESGWQSSSHRFQRQNGDLVGRSDRPEAPNFRAPHRGCLFGVLQP